MTGMFAAASTLYSQMKHEVKFMLRPITNTEERIETIVRQLRRVGYVVIPDYYSAAQCAFVRSEIDRLIAEQPDAVQTDKSRADCRVFGSEIASTLIRSFHDDMFCFAVGEAYRRAPLANFSTLAARLTAVPGNLGSGQGWHRDAFHFQYKSMIYLSDVFPENGPFELLPGSHRMVDVVRDTIMGRLDAPPASRISEEQITRLLTHSPRRSVSLPAAAGTLILFDSSTIHRGMPIISGTRYALTNYYFPPDHITPVLRKAFSPFAHA